MKFGLRNLLFLVAIIGVLIVCWNWYRHCYAHQIEIRNLGSRNLAVVDVTIWNRTIELNNLAIGQNASKTILGSYDESDVSVKAIFDDGSQLTHSDGYVCGGLSAQKWTIEINNNAIVIRQSKKNVSCL